MNSALRHTPDGFSRIIAASLILHAAVIVFALVIYKGGGNRIYMTPVTVSLVGPEALGRQGVSAAGHAAAAMAAAEAPAKKQAAGPAAKPVAKAVAVISPRVKGRSAEKTKSPFALKKAKDDNTVEDAIKRVKEKVRKKEAKEELQTAESHIDALKKKNVSSAPFYSSPPRGEGRVRGMQPPSLLGIRHIKRRARRGGAHGLEGFHIFLAFDGHEIAGLEKHAHGRRRCCAIKGNPYRAALDNEGGF